MTTVITSDDTRPDEEDLGVLLEQLRSLADRDPQAAADLAEIEAKIVEATGRLAR